MKKITALSLMAALFAVCFAVTAFAQVKDTHPAVPRFERLLPKTFAKAASPATALKTWNGSFVYQGVTYNYNMVGTDPSTGTSTTVNTVLIPIALSYTTSSGTTTFSPAHKLTNGQTISQNTVSSPIFQNGIDFTTNGVDVGNTQYIDAYQRGNFWGKVQSHPGYHVLLGQPKVAPVQTFSVPANKGHVANEFGVKVGLADIFWFDGQIINLMKKVKQIQPNMLPIFVTYDVYLTQFGGCCIGGYHSSFAATNGQQSYAHFTYIDSPTFAQDVSALSHEIGEWMDDPLVVNTNGNTVQCGILENGDPEEGFANFGGFPYTLNGFTYNLQDLVYLPYFGAPASTSAGGSLSFQGNPFNLGICGG